MSSYQDSKSSSERDSFETGIQNTKDMKIIMYSRQITKQHMT